nr:DUF6069 family protein [Sphaerisporangium cinnabarinum]
MSTTRSTSDGTSNGTSDATPDGTPHVPRRPRTSAPDGGRGPAARVHRPEVAAGARRRDPEVGAARRVPRWLVPPVAAVLAAVVLLTGTALGVDPVVRTSSGTQTVGVVAAVVVTLVVGYVGWGVRALLGRLRSGGRRAWLVTCGVVLLVSLLGPLGAVTPGAVALLAVEHLTVGATLALALRR